MTEAKASPITFCAAESSILPWILRPVVLAYLADKPVYDAGHSSFELRDRGLQSFLWHGEVFKLLLQVADAQVKAVLVEKGEQLPSLLDIIPPAIALFGGLSPVQEGQDLFPPVTPRKANSHVVRFQIKVQP